MKRLIIVLAAVIVISSYHPVGAATHVYPGPGNPIQTAIDGASAGDTIIVHPGTYDQQILLNKNDLTLRSSDGPAATIIDFTGVWCGYWSTGNGGVDIPYGVRGVTVEGFTIVGGSPASDALISIGGDGNTIRSNIVVGDPSSSGQDIGIHIGNVAEASPQKPSKNRILGNKVYNHAGSGIFVGNWAGIDNVISGNTVHDNVIGGIPGLNGNGIEVDRALGVTVRNNTLYNNEAAGIKVVRTAPNAVIEISYNTVTGNGTGVLSESWRPGAAASAVVSITCNNIFGNGFGVLNNAPVTINAQTNWWGDISGPFHPSLNPGGNGDDVSDNVAFVPWGLVFNPCAEKTFQWMHSPFSNRQICPLANYNIEKAEGLLQGVQRSLTDVQTLDRDTSEVELLVTEAQELLEKSPSWISNDTESTDLTSESPVP